MISSFKRQSPTLSILYLYQTSLMVARTSGWESLCFRLCFRMVRRPVPVDVSWHIVFLPILICSIRCFKVVKNDSWWRSVSSFKGKGSLKRPIPWKSFNEFVLDKASTTILLTSEKCCMPVVNCETRSSCQNSQAEYSSEDELWGMTRG